MNSTSTSLGGSGSSVVDSVEAKIEAGKFELVFFFVSFRRADRIRILNIVLLQQQAGFLPNVRSEAITAYEAAYLKRTGHTSNLQAETKDVSDLIATTIIPEIIDGLKAEEPGTFVSQLFITWCFVRVTDTDAFFNHRLNFINIIVFFRSSSSPMIRMNSGTLSFLQFIYDSLLSLISSYI